MPELPDLQVYAENLSARFAGRGVTDLLAPSRGKRAGTLLAVAASVRGARIRSVSRSGKEIWFAFDNGSVVAVHLMLSGYFSIHAEPPDRRAAAATLVLDDGSMLSLCDPYHKLTIRLNPRRPAAPDALDAKFTRAYLVKHLRRRPLARVKTILVDQKVVRGIGNAYADEILWTSRVSPLSHCGAIPEEAATRLHAAITGTLTEAIDRLRREHPGAISGEYRDFLAVHNPDRARSPSGAAINRITIDNRTTYCTDEQVLYTRSPSRPQTSPRPSSPPVQRPAGDPSSLPGFFHPLVAAWFAAKVGSPTDTQLAAWPAIARGEHALITAPTGTGKTLSAFLWAINQLVTGAWETGATRVLYISPLKALNNDIQRNLLGPLEELRSSFLQAGQPFPAIRALTRSGDTPSSERRSMLRHPPEILITTPESLNLLLSSVKSASILRTVTTVILDEIHAVAGSKRGTYLITAVDRLVRLAGEFQRIALSATVRPLPAVAAFVGSYTLTGHGKDLSYTARPVTIVRSESKKSYCLSVRSPAPDDETPFWNLLVPQIREIVARNRSTLVFTNNRALCERLTLLLNEGEPAPLAYAHHGSLSRELRVEVETKLKNGELRAIVATHSLELGIDVGAIDEVVLVQSPFSISSAIQRVGRAGHSVGAASTATIFPSHALDTVSAAVLVRRILEGDVEEVRPVACPLDVMAQAIVAMAATETWRADDLFAFLRTSHPFHSLERKHFDLVLDMLAGRYARSRIRDLRAQISFDRIDGTVMAAPGAAAVYRMSAGVIPDRGYFHLRHAGSGARIGDLDEEFVWETDVGRVMAFGTQMWRVEQITHNDVLVSPAGPESGLPPFWKGEEFGRDFHFAERIGEFLEKVNPLLDSEDLPAMLRTEYRMDEISSVRLIDHLRQQRSTTGCALPHRHHLVLEHTATGPGGAPGNQMILHTLWGGRVNRPMAIAMAAAWEERFGHGIEVLPGNDCIVLMLPERVRTDELLHLVTARNLDRLLRTRLEASGYFGARFRECAGRALLLPRASLHQRLPLWMSRLRSQRLLSAVRSFEDFPILLEAWRTCLQDEFELDALRMLLDEIDSGAIACSTVETPAPSPFAQSISWNQINTYMYATDELPGKSRLSSTLIGEVARTPELRPAIDPAIVRRFEERRQRLVAGYAPDPGRELVDWVKERIVLTNQEWDAAVAAVERDHGADRETIARSIADRTRGTTLAGAQEPVIIALETAHRLEGEPGSEEGLATVVAEWLRFFGPVSGARISSVFGRGAENPGVLLGDLIDDGDIIRGSLIAGSGDEFFCDAENFESLLRMARAARAPALKPLPVEWLQPFLAAQQSLDSRESGADGVRHCLERLACLDAPAALWEEEILPCRLDAYDPAWLDAIIHEAALLWVGTGRERVAFCFADETDLLPSGQGPDREAGELLPEADARYDFAALVSRAGLPAPELARRLWEGVWRSSIVNDSYHALRTAIHSGFAVESVAAKSSAPARPSRMRFARWKSAMPFAGTWRRLLPPVPPADLMDAEERLKDRARIVLDRYGVVFRELLLRELPGFQWAHLFRTLRLMELSGQAVGGCFFEGISGPQFASPQAIAALRAAGDARSWFMLNACDPASVCGLGLSALRGNTPPRIESAHCVYQGSRLMAVSRRQGSELTIALDPGDEDLPRCLAPLTHLLTRRFRPVSRIVLDTINGAPASESPYLDAMRQYCDVDRGPRSVSLHRR